MSGYFEEKAMPSAGFLPFVQSFICTFNNTCHDTEWTEPGRTQQYNQSLWDSPLTYQEGDNYIFSVKKFVGDLENSLVKNFDSEEKVTAFENVIQDFLLLRKLSSTLQSNPDSFLENGRTVWYT